MSTARRAVVSVVLCALLAPAAARGDALDDLLRRLAAAGRQTRTLSAKILQRKRAALFKSEVLTRGLFYFQRPDRVRWETLPPDTALLLVAGARAELRLPGEKPRVLDLQQGGVVASVINDMLIWFGVRPAGELRRAYVVKLEARTAPATRLALVPRDAALRKRIATIALEIGGDLTLRRVELRQADGDLTTIEFSDVARNVTLPQGAFR